MEFGPRALGARSILGDPRSKTMQKDLNLKIKFRESFRPFAPIILAEESEKWFEVEGGDCSPYMLQVSQVDKEKVGQIPAVTHVDHSARLQTVSSYRFPLLHSLLKAFHEKTGCPVLINTSFNIRGEPIVCTPQEAFHCFKVTNMDVLVLENVILRKRDQTFADDPDLIADHLSKFALD